MSLLGIDVGTTGVKAVVFDETGRLLRQAYREYPLHASGERAELDPHEVWEGAASAIREVADRDIEALAVTGLGEAFVPLSPEGEPLYRAMLFFDYRAREQCRRLSEALGEERWYAITGQPAHPMGSIHKIVWLRENEPDVYAAAHRYLSMPDFILHRLGVEAATDYSEAARTMAFDVQRLRWSEDVLDAAGLSAERLPHAGPSGTLVASAVGEAPRSLGLPRETKVVLGGHDQPCAALGSGAINPGEAAYGCGTVECITAVLPAFTMGLRAHALPCYPHVVPERFVSLAFNFTGGSLLRWFRDTLGRAEVEEASRRGLDAYDLITADLPEGPSDLFVLPHFTGAGTPYLDTEATGAIVGLTLATRYKDIVLAIMEGVVFEMAMNLRLMETAGVKVGRLRLVGGPTKSTRWTQIRADILGRPIETPAVTEASCLGAAMLAGVGAGVFADCAQAVEAMVKPGPLFEPDRERSQLYAARSAAYERLYPALRPIQRGAQTNEQRSGMPPG